MARFANVAFSDGSLLHGFNKRIEKGQPIVAPNDIRRYFVIPEESGELCLLSCIYGENRDIFFPKLSENLHLITFSEIAEKYLHQRGMAVDLCASEEEAREKAKNNSDKKAWPCLFTKSDTTGEKDFEEFFTDKETLDLDRFINLGVIKNTLDYNEGLLIKFENTIAQMYKDARWSKTDIVSLFHELLPDFDHKETGKYLDGKM